MRTETSTQVGLNGVKGMGKWKDRGKVVTQKKKLGENKCLEILLGEGMLKGDIGG
ncbi:unnamed protein product [Meloidogyne enterolobii]|uniref:Uncharacterized protein n=1 Tax=Meloidogyne enterolobii TaxID=390850 RepID=A0ACB1B2M5_MELEN